MNNIFSKKRFGQFACAEFRANGRQFVMIALVVGIVSFVAYGITYIAQDNLITLQGPFVTTIAALMIATLLYASMTFGKYFSRSKAVEAFMIPASKTEKFTYHYLQNIVIFPIAVILIATLITWVWVTITGTPFPKNIQAINIVTGIINILATLSVFFLGAVLFRRRPFLFTCLSIGAIIVVIVLIIVLTKDMEFWTMFRYWIEPYVQNLTLEEVTVMSNYFTIAMGLITTAVTTTIAWKKFKNLQTT